MWYNYSISGVTVLTTFNSIQQKSSALQFVCVGIQLLNNTNFIFYKLSLKTKTNLSTNASKSETSPGPYRKCLKNRLEMGGASEPWRGRSLPSIALTWFD